MFQTSWHGVSLDSFYKTSSVRLADSDFYESFYKIFFEKYSEPGALDPDWLRLKLGVIRNIEKKIFKSKASRILSIGCGLGLMEIEIRKMGYSNLEVIEVSEAPLRWIRKHLEADRIHIGKFPDCLPGGGEFDCILVSAIDYVFGQEEWIDFLRKVRSRLAPLGNCTVLGFPPEPGKPMIRLARTLRDGINLFLEKSGIRSRGQFWGYQRTLGEYREAFEKAGFKGLVEEFIDTQTPWLTCRLTGFSENHLAGGNL